MAASTRIPAYICNFMSQSAKCEVWVEMDARVEFFLGLWLPSGAYLHSQLPICSGAPYDCVSSVRTVHSVLQSVPIGFVSLCPAWTQIPDKCPVFWSTVPSNIAPVLSQMCCQETCAYSAQCPRKHRTCWAHYCRSCSSTTPASRYTFVILLPCMEKTLMFYAFLAGRQMNRKLVSSWMWRQKMLWFIHGRCNYNFFITFQKHIMKPAAALNHPVAECHVLTVHIWPVAPSEEPVTVKGSR